jgi:anti-sigma factor RsiW
MNCLEAQKHFADLLDHSRDERLGKVNDHLAACARCRQELAALAACQRLVSALPPVEPPAGFTTRVMAEVRDTAHRPNLWPRLFLSLQVKLPLQATAVILIGVLAVFIYQKESGQRQSTNTVPAPNGLQKQAEAEKLPPPAGRTRAIKPDAQNPEEAEAQEQRVKRLPRTEQPRSPAEPAEQSNIIGGVHPGAGKAASPPAPVNPANAAPSQPKEKSSPADEPGSVRQEQSLRSEGEQAKGVPSSAPLRESPSSAGLEEKRVRSSLDALSSRTAGFSDRDLILRLKHPARDDRNTEAASELERPQAEALPSQTGFKDLDHGRQRAIQTGQPQTVSTIIDASQYDEFKKELAGLGNIESELPAPPHKNEVKPTDQFRIKLTILPPNYSAQPPTR